MAKLTPDIVDALVSRIHLWTGKLSYPLVQEELQKLGVLKISRQALLNNPKIKKAFDKRKKFLKTIGKPDSNETQNFKNKNEELQKKIDELQKIIETYDEKFERWAVNASNNKLSLDDLEKDSIDNLRR